MVNRDELMIETSSCGDQYPEMCLDSSGDYVKFEDYEELSDRLTNTELELTRLKNKIANIFRDM